MDDWYNVSSSNICHNGGAGLLKHNPSPSSGLQNLYPEHIWDLKRFKHKPVQLQNNNLIPRTLFLSNCCTQEQQTIPFGFWKNISTHKNFFEWLMTQLRYTCMNDWYGVTLEAIQKHGGLGLLSYYYNNSPSVALQSVYPEHNWELGRSKHKPVHLWTKNNAQRSIFLKTEQLDTMPVGFWKSEANHKKFFDWPMSYLGYSCMDDWYNVTVEDIRSSGGRRVLNYYKDSPSAALLRIYPVHNWQPWKFKVIPNGFWNSLENQRTFFSHVQSQEVVQM